MPFRLVFANKLNVLENGKPLIGALLDYESSIDYELITVEDLDLGMGTTAIATQRHWEAYANIKYE